MSDLDNQGHFPEGERPEEMKEEASNASEESVQLADKGEVELDTMIDEVSYPAGEVPQPHLCDPEVSLLLNSEKLGADHLQNLIVESEAIIKEEVTRIQKLQKNIDQWESKIEKNKVLIEKNKAQAKQNNQEIVYDKKNRDYWFGRSEQVILDFNNASVSNREDSWAWLVKKYGLKDATGSSIDSRNSCVDELCNGEVNNLAGQYRNAAAKYEQAKKDKEAENLSLAKENSKYKGTIETLQKYVQSIYTYQIEPLQDGVLLLKELTAKLKSLTAQDQASYGDLREWAEEFLDEYLQENPKTHQSVVNDFRRISSIPLPPEFS